MNDEADLDIAELFRKLRRRMTLNCLAPFDAIDARTATALVSAGVLTSDAPRLAISPEVAGIVARRDHPNRIEMPLGPMVGHRDPGKSSVSLEFPGAFFLSNEPKTREAALRHFEHIRDAAPEVLSARVVRLLGERASDLLSEDNGRWMPAALALGDAIEVDISVNIAGIAQCVAINFPKGIPDFLQHVLRPSREALDSIQLTYSTPTVQRDDILLALTEIASSSASIIELCNAFFEQFGHLSLVAAYGLPHAVSSWKKLHSEVPIGEDLYAWAIRHPSPYARYHACLVFLTHPQDASTLQWNDIACLMVEVLGSFEPEPTDDKLSLPWEVRYDLAKHFVQYFEPIFPGQDERLATVAWRLADQFASCLGTEQQFISSVRSGTIQPEETRSAHLWLLCCPQAQASFLRYATLYLRSPWGYALLAAITDESAAALSAVDDALLTRIGRAFIQTLLYPSFSLPRDLTSPVCGDGRSLCRAAQALSAAIPRIEEITNISQIAEVGLRLLEPTDLLEGIAQCHEYSPQQMFLYFNALRMLIHSEPPVEAAVWDVLQNNEWREKFFSTAPLAVLELLSDAIAFLASTNDRWRAFGPHMFALGALAAVENAERRQALFALTVLLSLAAGANSAVRRILQTKQRARFRDDVTYWRDRISLAIPIASPWAQGRLRALLSELHFG